jgi:hypothetical protein
MWYAYFVVYTISHVVEHKLINYSCVDGIIFIISLLKIQKEMSSFFI